MISYLNQNEITKFKNHYDPKVCKDKDLTFQVTTYHNEVHSGLHFLVNINDLSGYVYADWELSAEGKRITLFILEAFYKELTIEFKKRVKDLILQELVEKRFNDVVNFQ